MTRSAEVGRRTAETSIKLRIELDGSGQCEAETGVAFFDHMLDQLARHSSIDLSVKAQGDLDVDSHHTVEDVGIALGEALSSALEDKRGICRFGSSLIPMEEALCRVALDISGRAHLSFEVPVPSEQIGNYDPELTHEFFVAFSRASGITLHIKLVAGRNSHHIVESVFKGVAVALGQAVSIDPRRAGGVPSTKGVL